MLTKYHLIIYVFLSILIGSACGSKTNSRTKGIGLEHINPVKVNGQLLLQARLRYEEKVRRHSTRKYLKSVGYEYFLMGSPDVIIPILYTRSKVSPPNMNVSNRLADYLEFYPDCPLYGAFYALKSDVSLMLFLDLSKSMYLPLTTNPCQKKMNVLTNVSKELNFLKERKVLSTDYAFFIDGVYDLLCISSGDNFFAIDVNSGIYYSEIQIIKYLYRSE